MRKHSDWLRAYCDHTYLSEAPTIFHFWTGVSAIAGALRRRVWIDQRHYQWTPNFYIVLVAPPGIATKSTTIRTGLRLLEKVPNVHFGPQSTTWQALTQSLAESLSVVTTSDGKKRPMCCITIAASELGTFFRPDDKEFIDVLVDMWDGQEVQWRRRTKIDGEVIIRNPWLNLIACTTPAWLKESFPDVMIGGGLTSRVVFVYADKKRRLIAYPADLITSSEYEQEELDLAQDLCRIGQLQGEYRLTKEAKEWGVEWYKNLWSTRPLSMASERYSGYIARKQTHLHKLAIVLAASRRDKLIIEKAELVEAEHHLVSIEEDMRHVFASIGTHSVQKFVSELLTIIKTYKKIEYSRLRRMLFNIIPDKEFTQALQSLIAADYIKARKEGDRNMLIYNFATKVYAEPPQEVVNLETTSE